MPYYPSITVRVSQDLEAAITARRKSLGYPTDAAYLRAVVRQDILDLPCHRAGLAVQEGPAWRRDVMDAALLAHLQNQLARGGGGGRDDQGESPLTADNNRHVKPDGCFRGRRMLVSSVTRGNWGGLR
jgi:hypothetical protein